MAEKSLLDELKEKRVNIEKVLETSWLNITIPTGSLHVDGIDFPYPKDKIELLLNEVPSVFSYEWTFEEAQKLSKGKELTQEQEKALAKINETGSRNPMFGINRYTASKIITVFRHCSENYQNWQ